MLIALGGAVTGGVGHANQRNVRMGGIAIQGRAKERGDIPPVKRLQHHFVGIREMIGMHMNKALRKSGDRNVKIKM